MKFTCKLRELLAARGMCQYQLAAAAGMSTTGMSKIAAGDRLPHQDTVERITAALGCAPADIWPDYARHLSERTERQRPIAHLAVPVAAVLAVPGIHAEA